ncbi:hypothetical protein OG749_02265 [Streptomyces nojiriensis]|uniref:hypothetical protein n=1 Tax=Streptomyces nojiriensis TaxID=66374 RepID=UPI002E194553
MSDDARIRHLTGAAEFRSEMRATRGEAVVTVTGDLMTRLDLRAALGGAMAGRPHPLEVDFTHVTFCGVLTGSGCGEPQPPALPSCGPEASVLVRGRSTFAISGWRVGVPVGGGGGLPAQNGRHQEGRRESRASTK